MKLTKANFSKKQLDQLSEKEKVFFVQLAHLLDELMILAKCVKFATNPTEVKEEVKRIAQYTQALFFIKILAGKIYEGWKMLQTSYFSSKLSHKYDKLLSEPARKSINELKKYFAKNNIIREIRRKYAFHYDRKKIKDQLNNITQDETLSMFITEHQGTSLFAFSDTIINSALLDSVNPSNQKAMDLLFKEVILKVCKWFQDFGYEFIKLIMEKLEFDFEEIQLEDVKSIKHIELPYFIRRGNQ
jgi:hypothetical protein